MPLIELAVEVILGMAFRLIVAGIAGMVRFVLRHSWGLVVHHPFLTAVLGIAALRNGWLAAWPTVMTFLPPLIATLVLIAGVRAATDFYVDDTHRLFRSKVRREVRQRRRDAREYIHDARDRRTERRQERDRIRDLPPPPVPPPPAQDVTGAPTAPADVIDVHEVPTPPPIPVGPVSEGATR